MKDPPPSLLSPSPSPSSSTPDIPPHILPSSLKTPFIRTASTLSPSPPLSFTTVIEDDHSRINAIAITLARSLAKSISHSTQFPHPDQNSKQPESNKQHCSEKQPQPPTVADVQSMRHEQLQLLQELTWRLIRHDVSEDLIMRPAFAHYLGHEGREMGEHDREDHEHARGELLSLYGAFEALPLDVDDGMGSSSDVRTQSKATGDLAALANRFRTLIGRLSEHMSLESGTCIPRLESLLSQQESQELARRYLRTYVLAPDLRLDGKSVWPGGVGEYVRTGREIFHELWEAVQREEAGLDRRKQRKL